MMTQRAPYMLLQRCMGELAINVLFQMSFDIGYLEELLFFLHSILSLQPFKASFENPGMLRLVRSVLRPRRIRQELSNKTKNDKRYILSYYHVFYQIDILPLQGESTLASISQPADEFTFGHTGHMAIILGRLATLIPAFLTNLVMLIVSFFSFNQLTYVYQE